MTRQEAYKAMENGAKITHPNFSSDEFYHLVNGKIMAEDGVNHTSVFYDDRNNGAWRADGWEIRKEEPKDFYFTFGDIHETLTGIRMDNRWVRVTAPDYGAARECFCREFATPLMGDPAKWSFQYEAENFKPEYCPLGEYEHLIATP